jgi:choline dehydrogenase-like flavoprotein
MWADPSREARFEVPLRQADRERMRAIECDVDAMVARIGRTRSGCDRQWAPLGTGHLFGSCRMGAHDDGTSVADPTGMVWGVEGLHLATNGLIPTRLAVNPTLTTAALALRAAERLVG